MNDLGARQRVSRNGGQAAELLEPVEAALDHVPTGIDGLVEGGRSTTAVHVAALHEREPGGEPRRTAGWRPRVSSMDRADLVCCDATELAAAIATGTASAVEVVQAHLDRIESVGTRVNAFVTLHGEQALREAARPVLVHSAACRSRSRTRSTPLVSARLVAHACSPTWYPRSTPRRWRACVPPARSCWARRTSRRCRTGQRPTTSWPATRSTPTTRSERPEIPAVANRPPSPPDSPHSASAATSRSRSADPRPTPASRRSNPPTAGFPTPATSRSHCAAGGTPAPWPGACGISASPFR